MSAREVLEQARASEVASERADDRLIWGLECVWRHETTRSVLRAEWVLSELRESFCYQRCLPTASLVHTFHPLAVLELWAHSVGIRDAGSCDPLGVAQIEHLFWSAACHARRGEEVERPVWRQVNGAQALYYVDRPVGTPRITVLAFSDRYHGRSPLFDGPPGVDGEWRVLEHLWNAYHSGVRINTALAALAALG